MQYKLNSKKYLPLVVFCSLENVEAKIKSMNEGRLSNIQHLSNYGYVVIFVQFQIKSMHFKIIVYHNSNT